MLNRESLFVVINPTLPKHVAFERAISIANSRSIKPHIVTFIGVDSTRIDDNPANAALFRTDQWVEDHIHAPLRQHNLTSTVIPQLAGAQSLSQPSASRVLPSSQLSTPTQSTPSPQ